MCVFVTMCITCLYMYLYYSIISRPSHIIMYENLERSGQFDDVMFTYLLSFLPTKHGKEGLGTRVPVLYYLKAFIYPIF